MSFMCCPSGSLIPSVLKTFPLSILLYSKYHTNVLNEFMHSLYPGVCLVLTFGKQFQVIHKQQMIQFESFVAPFIASLSSFNYHVNGTIHKTNNNGDKLSPWKIPLLIPISPNVISDAFNSNFHDFMLLFKKSYTLFAIRNNSKHSLI